MGKLRESHIYALNKKVSYNYNIHEKFEAGIVLIGHEVKSVRFRKCSIDESFIVIKKHKPIIENFHIGRYQNSSDQEIYNPIRSRLLLMHSKEINKITGLLQKKGFTLVPIKIYNSKNNFIKLEIALVSGKKQYDKRETIKNREWQRDKQRMLKEKIKN